MLHFSLLMLMVAISHAAEEEVYVPPSFQESLPLQRADYELNIRLPENPTDPTVYYAILQEGHTISFPCNAVGTPRPSYRWYFNGAGVESIPQLFSVDSLRGDLTVQLTDANFHEGILNCTARNIHGRAVSDKMEMLKASASVITVGPKTVVVTEGASLMLPGCSGIKSAPPAKYTWSHFEGDDPQPLPFTSRISIMDNGSLWFSHVRSDDQVENFLYKCKAYNTVLQTTNYIDPVKLNVTRRTDGETTFPVQFAYSNYPDGQALAIEGGRFTAKCLFKGGSLESREGPKVQWTRIGGLMPEVEVGKEKERGNLIFPSVKKADEGEYRCTGSIPSSGSSDSFTITLRVESKPTFVVPPQNAVVSEMETAEIACDARGDPEPVTTWYMNGDEISGDYNHKRYRVSEDKKRFVVRDACKKCHAGGSDLMVLQCHVQNKHGYLFSQAYINVLENTVITSPPKDLVLARSADSAVLTCKANSDPSTAVTYSWSLNEESITPREGRHDVYDNGTIRINLTSSQNQQELMGEYECVAWNGYSDDRAVAEVSFADSPGPDITAAGFMEQFWWILVVIAVILILFFICITCWCCWYWNRGDEYPVDEKERAHGLYPEEELFELGFHEYQRPEAISRKGSLSSNIMLTEADLDQRSLARAYSTDSLGRFTEDGSFIGQYNTAKR